MTPHSRTCPHYRKNGSIIRRIAHLRFMPAPPTSWLVQRSSEGPLATVTAAWWITPDQRKRGYGCELARALGERARRDGYTGPASLRALAPTLNRQRACAKYSWPVSPIAKSHRTLPADLARNPASGRRALAYGKRTFRSALVDHKSLRTGVGTWLTSGTGIASSSLSTRC